MARSGNPTHLSDSGEKSEIPPTEVGGMVQIQPTHRDDRFLENFAGLPLRRLDLNHPPTAVGGISNETSIEEREGSVHCRSWVVGKGYASSTSSRQ